jgi:hypothetical protein
MLSSKASLDITSKMKDECIFHEATMFPIYILQKSVLQNLVRPIYPLLRYFQTLKQVLPALPSIHKFVCPHIFMLVHSFIHSFVNGSTAFLLGPGLSFSFVIFFYTDGRTPWTSAQPVTRPLPTHRTTQTQNKRTHRYPYFEWDSNS